MQLNAAIWLTIYQIIFPNLIMLDISLSACEKQKSRDRVRENESHASILIQD